MLEIIDDFCWEKHNKTLTYEHHGINGLRNFAHWNLSTASLPTPLHHHTDIIEIHCLTKGKRVCHIEEETYTITGNELVITYPCEPHYTSSNNLSPCAFFGFQIDVSDKEHLLGLDKEYSSALYEILTSLQERHLRFTVNDSKLLALAFMNISDNDPWSLKLGIQYLCCFLFKIPDFVPVRKEEKNITDENIKRVTDFIEKRFSEPIHLKELAAISGYSLSRFKIKFKEIVGITPANYITFKKLEYAKNLLTETQLPITQIALDAGFSSSNYFGTVFNKFTKYTPTEFRKRFLEKKHHPTEAE